ncbi:MAG: glycosyltransferase [Acidobacteriota bacterium]
MKKKIRILHILHSFSAGGLENGVVNLINGSPNHLEHELCVLTGGSDFLDRLKFPVAHHELHKREGNDISMLRRLAALIRKGNYDLVHTRNWSAFDGVLASWTVPQVVVVHGEHGRDIRDPKGLNHRRNLIRRLAGLRVKRFVAVSSDLYRWLKNIVAIPEAKLILIHNGVETDKYRPFRDVALRQELGIGPEEFVVGTVARLDPVKNHEGMINAVGQLNRDGKSARLIIVGEGPNRSALESLIQTWPFGPRPILTGYRPDAWKYYGVFDVFILNSHAEGMSNTQLEAMACGLPVICTPVGGNAELVEDGVSGQYTSVGDDADLADKILKYKDDPDLRSRHGAAARAFVIANHSLNKMISSYVSLYESFFAEHQTS